MRFLIFLLLNSKATVISAAVIGLIAGSVNAKLISFVSTNVNLLEAGLQDSIPLYGALVLSALITGFVSEMLLILLAERLTFNLRMNICRQILDLPLRRAEEVGASKFTVAFTQDIPSLTVAMLRIPTFFINAAITVGSLVYLGMISLQVLGVLVFFMTFAVISYVIPEKRAVRNMQRTRDAWDDLLNEFNAMNTGFKELKLHQERREAFFSEVLQKATEKLRLTSYAHKVIYAFLDNWSNMIFFIFIGILLFVMPIYSDITIQTVTSYTLVVLYLAAPIDALINSIPRFRQADVSLGKIRKIGLSLDVDRIVLEDKNSEAKARIAAELSQLPPFEKLRMVDMCHTYYREREERHFTMGPMDLTFRKGELVFLIGGNGSGKTTLAKLLVGLYSPKEGHIELNGKAVTEADIDQFRQYFTAIFTDFHVFDSILGLDSDALDSKATDLLKKLMLDHKVTVKNGQLSTVKLSTGQRKRLALVVAYLENRPFYLFDEWAADQDPEFKEVFYRQLLPELKAQGKTILVISHDDRYFNQADRIIKLADGKIQSDVRPEVAEVG